jgi:hypothetical protein
MKQKAWWLWREEQLLYPLYERCVLDNLAIFPESGGHWL